MRVICVVYTFFVLVALDEFKEQIAIGQDKQQSIYVVADPSTSDANLINRLPAGYSIVWVNSTKTDDPENTVYIMLTDYDDRTDIENFINQGKKVYVLPEGYVPPRDAPVTNLSIPRNIVPETDPTHIPPETNNSENLNPETGSLHRRFDFLDELFDSFFIVDPAYAALVCNNHEVVGGVIEPSGSCSFPVDKSNEISGYFKALDRNNLPTGSLPWRYYVVTNNDAPGNLEFVSDYGRDSLSIWANFWKFDWSSGGQICVNQGTKAISSFGSCYRTNVNGVPHFWYVVGSWHRSWPFSLPWCSTYPNGNGILIWNFCTSQYETFYFKAFNRPTTYGCPQYPFFGELVGNENNYNCPPINSNGTFYLKRAKKNCSTCSVQEENTLKSLGYRCRHDLGTRYSYIVEAGLGCSTVESCKYRNVKFKDPAGTNHCP